MALIPLAAIIVWMFCIDSIDDAGSWAENQELELQCASLISISHRAATFIINIVIINFPFITFKQITFYSSKYRFFLYLIHVFFYYI